jgi:protocatechuate 3,4-dioxygenase beta subunit
MYFPGDQLLEHDPIYLSTADERARQRLVSVFDWIKRFEALPGYLKN